MDQHPFLDISKLMHCGVYVLLRKGEVIYVGKSKQPLMRIHTHVRNRNRPLGQGFPSEVVKGPAVNGKGINFDAVWFLPCMLGQLGVLETYFIRKYLPRYNVQGKPAGPIPDEIKALLKQMVVIADLPPSRDTPTRAPSGPYMIRRF